MSAMLDERQIEFEVYEGRSYYNKSNAARYVGMTNAGLLRKFDRIKREQGITVPFVMLPLSMQSKYIDKRILDVFRKSVTVGREQEWYDELRRVVDEVSSGK